MAKSRYNAALIFSKDFCVIAHLSETLLVLSQNLSGFVWWIFNSTYGNDQFLFFSKASLSVLL